MLLPAAASYIRPADVDVESAYGTYHGLWPRHTLDTWSNRALLKIPGPEQVRDDESERWPDKWPPNEEPPRIVRFNTPRPPPPYTELPPARPADRQQVRKKPVKPQPQTAGVSARKRCLGRLKTNRAAFGHQVKTRWVPAMQQEFLVFLGYLAGYDRDGKPLTTLGLN